MSNCCEVKVTSHCKEPVNFFFEYSVGNKLHKIKSETKSTMKIIIIKFDYPLSKTRHFFCQTPLKLADPTELQLVGVGADFVFLWKEGRRNQHLASSRPYIRVFNRDFGMGGDMGSMGAV